MQRQQDTIAAFLHCFDWLSAESILSLLRLAYFCSLRTYRCVLACLVLDAPLSWLLQPQRLPAKAGGCLRTGTLGLL